MKGGLAGGRPRPREMTYANGWLASGRQRPSETTNDYCLVTASKTTNRGWQMAVQGQEKRRKVGWQVAVQGQDELRMASKGKSKVSSFFFFFSGHGRHVKTSLPTRHRQAGTRQGLACWREFEYLEKAKRQKNQSQEALSIQNSSAAAHA